MQVRHNISTNEDVQYSKFPPLRNSVLRNSGLIKKKYALLLETQQAVFCQVTNTI